MSLAGKRHKNRGYLVVIYMILAATQKYSILNGYTPLTPRLTNPWAVVLTLAVEWKGAGGN